MGHAADPPAWLTPLEVAALLRVHPRTVRNWLRTQQLAGVKIGANWRIDATALDAALHVPAPARPAGTPSHLPRSQRLQGPVTIQDAGGTRAALHPRPKNTP